ncbi:MAG: hypothetical protein R2684_09160 [Pyrinomonadaceae bacterium]
MGTTNNQNLLFRAWLRPVANTEKGGNGVGDVSPAFPLNQAFVLLHFSDSFRSFNPASLSLKAPEKTINKQERPLLPNENVRFYHQNSTFAPYRPVNFQIPPSYQLFVLLDENAG